MLNRRIAYICVLASAIGASAVSVQVAGVQLSVFRATVVILLALTLVDALHKMSPPGQRNRVSKVGKLTYSHKFMIFWLASSVLSVLWSLDTSGWMRATFFIFIGSITTLLFFKTFTNISHFIIAFRIMAVMTIMHNVIGWYEIYSGNLLFLRNSVDYYSEHGLAASMFGNTNNFATYLLVSLSALLVAANSVKSRLLKLIYHLTIVSSILLILNADSRANIIALSVGIIVILVAKSRTTLRAITYTTVALVVALTLSLMDMKLMLKNLGIENLLIFSFDNTSSSEGIRLNLIQNGLYFLKETALFGTGAGNIEYWMENRAIYPTSGVLNIHNWWFEILVSFGVVVFFGYVAMVLVLVVRLIHASWTATDKQTRDCSVFLAAGLLAFAVGSISSSSNLLAEWLWIYYAVAINFVSKIKFFNISLGNSSLDQSRSVIK